MLPYLLAIAAIVAFCFWQPAFPKKLAPKLGIQSERAQMIFLVIYWIAIPVVIHRLMAMMLTA
ncbi:MAG TPA: hypothetical protein DCS82_11260 [Rhodospirillaceae bacterium]|nr:hypothetical protein [Rhodospirillaceae bacterium]HAA93376.1 hypothetical protein [Rhodospirillaceae bacterium]HAT36287.1 hypothetical protein [Rhodospirillaceae bacterium]